MRILTVLLIILPLGLSSQATSLDAFGASITEAGVYLRWTISVGNTCEGVEIERAEADSIWHQVGRIEGICGSLVEPVDYDFLDGNPLVGRTITYRLVLGVSGTSTRVTVNYVDYNESGYWGHFQTDPHCYYLRSRRVITEPVSYTIFDMSGTILHQGQHQSSETLISLDHLRVGIYIFVVYKEGRVQFSNRFIKLR
jgi:hypothetical protein